MNNFKDRYSYGKETISYEVRNVDRKSMEIAVYPDSSVIVKVPKGTTPSKVKIRIAKRARWIKKQIDYFGQFEPRVSARCYVGGETHFYLGRQYRLKITKRNNNEVKLKGSYFLVLTPNKDPHKVKSLLEEWYQDHAKLVFNRRLELCYKSAKKLNVPFPNLQLRSMKKRWGSCSKAGKILLNTALIKAPLYCIDYVIMHELCHMKVNTHDNGYFKLLSKCMPDWKKRKERLEKCLT
jgi:predicted metal-dependent hydrolase